MVKEKLLDKVRYAIRVRHLSYRTEETYSDIVKWLSLEQLSSCYYGNIRHKPQNWTFAF